MKYTKIPFYFRTIAQYDDAKEYLSLLTAEAYQKFGLSPRPMFSADYITMRSTAHGMSEVRAKIPKTQPGRKKYVATIGFTPKLYELFTAERNMEEELVAALGVELVNNEYHKPKYNEEDITRTVARLKSPTHFKKLVFMLNKEFGHGNWHLRGAKRILTKLSEAQNMKDFPSIISATNSKSAKEIIAKGLRVEVVVTSKVDNLDKLLFKLQLMT